MKLRGVYTALITPFRGESVDWDALETLVDAQIEAGIHGLVPCGTTGESATLSVEEHDQLVAFVVRCANGRVPVIAGAGSNSTREAVARTRHACESGAVATLQVVPYYNRPGQDGIVDHYRAIADVGLPIVTYNIPGRTGVALTLDSYRRLADLPEIVATKEATGDLCMAQSILAEQLMPVLSGDDGLLFPLVCLGGHGVISVASNVLPAEMVALYEATVAGELERARAAHFRLIPLFRALFLECNPAPVKAALARQGLIDDILRLPLSRVGAETRAELDQVLNGLGH